MSLAGNRAEGLPFYIVQMDFTEKELSDMFEHFFGVEWESDTYIFAGRPVTPKRKTFMYGKNYSYSGQNKKAHQFSPQINLLASAIEEKLGVEAGYFNGCLLNLYEDGDAGISYHKDDERQMDKEALIVAFSLGAERKFYLKNDRTKEVEKIASSNGSLIVMEPSAQTDWTHSIPKEKKVKSPRISFTFRRFL